MLMEGNRRRHFVDVLPRHAGKLVVPGARFAIFFTIVAWIVYLFEQIVRLNALDITIPMALEAGFYLATVTLLTVSCLAFMIARLAHYERVKTHERIPRSIIDSAIEESAPTVTILVPSYREEEKTIRYTLLSAAFQEYPELRVVLLIDDPPYPSDPEHQASLDVSRNVANRLMEQLSVPLARCIKAADRFEELSAKYPKQQPDTKQLTELATHYDAAAEWFYNESAALTIEDHVDTFFAIDVLTRLGTDLSSTAQALRSVALDPDAFIPLARVRQLYRRLVNIFQAEISSFERKRYGSLSHEPNKAMNLNSYVSLMGESYERKPSSDGLMLVPSTAIDADLHVPDADYLLTLDADSVLLPEYCLRLVYHMEQEENQRIAVSQTPYSSFPAASASIERIAGATTDIQHIVHQGMEHHNAAFWVGANAVIRKSAIMELEECDYEDGIWVKRYINDRTVIEDTESSISLRSLGWKIFNYPERLSYSATPPDLGSLIVQRKRWANGGLIILPQLLRLFSRKNNANKISILELLLRSSYLASIAWTSICLCTLFFFPFADGLLSSTAILIAAPYFITMTIDLIWLGYRKTDIFWIYGFNLLLQPVNIAGTVESIVQIIGGHKLAFARTPKIGDRTPAPMGFLLVIGVFLVWSIWTLRNDIINHDLIHLAFTVTNLSMLLLATVGFIGIKNFWMDLYYSLRDFVYVQSESAVSKKAEVTSDWASVLYDGGSLPLARHSAAASDPNNIPNPTYKTLENVALAGDLLLREGISNQADNDEPTKQKAMVETDFVAFEGQSLDQFVNDCKETEHV